MAVILILAGIAGLLWGLIRPDQMLPSRLGAPSRGKVLALYGGSLFLGGLLVDTDPLDVEAESAIAADTTGLAAGTVVRDSLLAVLVAEVEQVPDAGSARTLAEKIQAERAGLPLSVDATSLDSLWEVAINRASELTLYERARALPASDLEGNQRAYQELASRYPTETRYREKAAEYTERIADLQAREQRAALRRAERQARRQTSRSSSGCCRRCVKGKPCGNSCISRSYTCRQPPGCAC